MSNSALARAARLSVPALLLLACRASEPSTDAPGSERAPDYPAITIEGSAYDTAMRVPLPPEIPEEMTGLHNVFHLSDSIISGSEPHGTEALEHIRDMGVKTILSVDGKVPDAETAAALGMRYVHIPIQYKGMTKDELAEISKTFRELEGPFYVHCFHGKHRGPAAAAVGRIVLDGADRQTAIGEMRQYCGTSSKYEGLYRDVATAYIPPPKETSKLDFDFPARKEPRGVTGVMVHLSRSNDNLDLLKKRAFAVDPEHPDVDPLNEAEKIHQAFELSMTFPEVREGPADFNGWFRDSEVASGKLVDALRRAKAGDSGAADEAAEHWQAVKDACSACHNVYRNDW